MVHSEVECWVFVCLVARNHKNSALLESYCRFDGFVFDCWHKSLRTGLNQDIRTSKNLINMNLRRPSRQG